MSYPEQLRARTSSNSSTAVADVFMDCSAVSRHLLSPQDALLQKKFVLVAESHTTASPVAKEKYLAHTFDWGPVDAKLHPYGKAH